MGDETTSATTSPAADELQRLVDELATVGEDAEIECRLPHARLAAGAELTGAPGRAPWPPALADPFPHQTDGLPEIGRDDITGATLAGGILHHGAVIVRGVLGPSEVDRFRRGIDRAFDARTAAQAADDPPTSPWFTPFRPGRNTVGQQGKSHLVRLVDVPRLLQDVLATYRRLGLLDAVADYFDEPPVITANKAVLRRIEVPAAPPLPTDFHQDGRFMGDDVRSVNLWVTLTDCLGDAPSLDLIPRREAVIHPTGQGDSGFDWTLSASQVAAMAGEAGIERLELRAGDAVVFDHRLVHRTGYDRSMTAARLAIELWCFAPSHAPAVYQPLLA